MKGALTSMKPMSKAVNYRSLSIRRKYGVPCRSFARRENAGFRTSQLIYESRRAVTSSRDNTSAVSWMVTLRSFCGPPAAYVCAVCMLWNST